MTGPIRPFAPSAFETVLERLGDIEGGGLPGGNVYRCPAHDDNKASLSVAEGDDGKVLLHCFAGCETGKVVAALGLEMADLFNTRGSAAVVQQYVYTDEAGVPLLRVLRTEPKGFTQERWDGDAGMWKPRLLDTRRVPYRLPELIAAKAVWLVEGEKDVESIRAAGMGEGEAATTLLGGAGKWHEEYADLFRGKFVYIIADNDDAGIQGALKVKTALRGVAKGVHVFLPSAGKDVTDHLNAGYGLGDLRAYTTETDDLFEPFDWTTYKVEKSQWLFEPWVPVGSRVMAYGAAGSLKSLWAMWLAAKLAIEGHKVAYFSLEMRPSETAKRLKRLAPPAENFKWYSRFAFSNARHLNAACELLKGYSLIVIDSWSAVQGDTNNNDLVATLDREVFQPLIDETGATLLILDNTGHPSFTNAGRENPDWARGATAKGDKMDINLFFERGDSADNHRTTVSVKKMRLDKKIPRPLTIWTTTDEIEFYACDAKGSDLGPLWTFFGRKPIDEPASAEPVAEGGVDPWPTSTGPTSPSSTLRERLAAARAKGTLGEITPSDVSAEPVVHL